MTTPAIKDQTLVTQSTFTQGLATKEPSISVSTASQYFRGDKSWRDFAGDVRAAVLTGLSTASSAAISATDSVLGAFGKLQKQITDLTTTVGGKESSIAAGTTAQYFRGDKTWQTLNKSVVGLSSVDNTSDTNKPISTATATALSNKIESSEKGAANGVATLGSDSKIPAAQLPSYVDDVIEVATKAALPAIGESGKIYLVLADESRNSATEQYRWSGSIFSRIPTSPGSTDEVTEGTTRLYFTESRVRATILSGLSLASSAVITVSDSVLSALGKLQKQVSDIATSVSGKEGTIAAGTNTQYYRGDKTWQDIAGAVRGTILTGLSTATISVVLSTDSLLNAIGKLQAQITDLTSTVSGKESSIASGATTQYFRGDKSWRDFATDVRGTILTGLSTTVNAAVLTTDSILTAIGKLQKQVSDTTASLAFKEPALAPSTTDKYYRGDKSWQDFASTVRIVTLTGLSTADVSAVTNLDNVLSGIGKLQAQFSNLGISKPGTSGSLDVSGIAGGYAGINFTASGGSLRDTGAVHSFWRPATGDLWTCDNNGLFLAKGDVGSSSDETLKTNWRNFSPDFIKQLANIKHGIYDRIDIDATQVGVSAQSILKEAPDLHHTVHEGPDGKLTVAYANAALVSAVKLAADAVRKDELIAQQAELIRRLTERVDALENKSA